MKEYTPRNEYEVRYELLAEMKELENTLDLLGTMLQNEWIDTYALEGILDYSSIDVSEFVEYLTEAEWFQGERDKEQLQELIDDLL